MSKNKLLGLISFICLSYEAFSIESNDSRLRQLEQQMHQILAKNSAGSMGAVFSNKDNKSLDYGWAMDIELLLWHAKSGGVDWALVLDQGYYPISGSMKNLGFGWDWGVRVGVTKYF
ncbi:MAG: hypothetical protein WCG10_00950, partial [Chlamydiota bacterium]